ncbi:HD-GYP domain, c-di-GMP phosphodiesterase class II (or its inactivated variant) [Duganella sp. CF402]|uniref:HD-GYP domain-containing protein n=1 Tax=unclassified Duganella TaxID=2636909 RepID=UPI0008B5E947|nr:MULTISPECIES: HD domain-containing phosphohydrolase [unclassified Duganella]RZT05478.1 HD-GYP domain-containing protein (c-di-GMP phosphodiesterase class II) [Duganella sp. BK701]SEN02592.1 HD-GYP domain, c-di-GMP phosphodiesterase class II (or its inactivated variant) [Duganella sp. CF402]
MNIRKVTAADLKLGMLLPWDVYGENGALLIRKGHMIASANQIAYLVERGMFEDGQPASVLADPPSVLRKLNAAYLELHTLLQAVSQGVAPPDFRRKLDDIALLVHAAIDLNVDIATASILHNQQQAPYAARHSVNTAIVAVLLARSRQRSRNDVMTVTLAALTMNTGMLEHHQRWHDSNAVLDAADHARKLAHPERSVQLLRAAGVNDEAWLHCVLHHHENEDGTGYPCNKVGAQIPLLSKLVALADRYCARVSERSYRPTLSAHAALRDMLMEARTTLDTNLVSLVIKELGIYPIGTYVRMLNGEVGVVSRRGLQSTTPHVESVIGPRGAPLEVFLQRDTRHKLHAIREVLSNAQVAALNAPPLRMAQVWGRAAVAD